MSKKELSDTTAENDSTSTPKAATSYNPTESPIIETLVKHLKKGKSEFLLNALEKGDVILLEKRAYQGNKRAFMQLAENVKVLEHNLTITDEAYNELQQEYKIILTAFTDVFMAIRNFAPFINEARLISDDVEKENVDFNNKVMAVFKLGKYVPRVYDLVNDNQDLLIKSVEHLRQLDFKTPLSIVVDRKYLPSSIADWSFPESNRSSGALPVGKE